MLDRPWYDYNIYQAANLARKLSIPKISVIEFGVSAGNGLLNIEKHVKRVSSLQIPLKQQAFLNRAQELNDCL